MHYYYLYDCIDLNYIVCHLQGVDGILCDERHNHKNSCHECSQGYRIIEDIKLLMEGADVTLFNAMDTSQLSNDRETISQCKSNLDILRSHLARHHTEAEADSLDVANLDDDTAIVIADFKNNILDCMFRENMVKFFGKNGTNDLGFMRIIKGSDSSELEATFYHFVSNDKLKDTQSVLSAKYELYTKHMPAHIKNV